MNSNTTKKNHLMRVITVIALMCVLLLSTALIASATETETEAATEVTIVKEGTCGTGLTWKLDSEGTLTISGNGSMIDYTDLNAVPWAAYKKTAITSVVVEEGVYSIGRLAFHSCLALADVQLPESLKSISEYAFYSCTALTSVDIPANVFSIGQYAFRQCKNVTGINFAKPDNWTITDTANDAVITEFDVSDPAAAKQALHKTYYHKCEWFRPLDAEGEAAILGSGAVTETINWSLNDFGVLSITGTGDMPVYRGTEMPWCLYRGAIQTVEIGEGITSLGNSSFYAFVTVRNVILPSTLTTMKGYAFYRCTNLLSVNIPASMTSIGSYAFRKCPTLTDIDFEVPYGWSANGVTLEAYELCGTGVVDYTNRAYYKYEWVKDTEVNSGIMDVTVLDYGTLAYTEVRWRVVDGGFLVISGTGDMPDYATTTDDRPWAKYLNDINTIIVMGSVNSIGKCAFISHLNVTDVIIYNGVKKFADNAFAYSTSIEEITIPSSVEYIGVGALRISSLKSATLNDTIGWTAGTTALESVNLGDAATAATYLKSTYRSKAWTNADPTPDNPEVSEDPAESPLPPLSGTIEVVTTNSYGYNEEYYTFLPRTTATHTFILPAGLGFYSKAEFDVYGNAEVGFYDNVAGTSFSVDLEAGVAYEFYVGATVEDSWTIEWTLGEPEEDPNAGVIGENATNLYLGSNTVYVNASDIENGTLNFAFEVTEAGNYSFNSMMLWASVYDADGNEIYDNYLVPGVYTVSINTAWVNLGTYEMIVEYSYPSLEVGENTVTFEEADLTDGLQYSFYVSKPGTYQFVVDGGMAIICDADGNMISRVMSWLESGEYIIKMMASAAGDHTVTVSYTAPTLAVGDNTITLTETQAAEGFYFYYEFTAESDGAYTFANVDGIFTVYVYDMAWNAPTNVDGEYELAEGTTYMVEVYGAWDVVITAGDHVLNIGFTAPTPEEPPVNGDNIDPDGWTGV